MKRRILICLLIMLSCFSLTSCKENENNQNEEPERKTEYMIKDDNLIAKEVKDDNYRVFYEIFTGSFSDSNGDGVGDLQGIINRLDYLNDGDPNSGKSLGIEGIWLTPIFSSPSYHKYDVTNYYKIDEKFGTMDDLTKLIEECHKRDIKIILDLVINHTGKNNLWFQNFMRAHENNDPSDPYYDFYSYCNPDGDRTKGTFNKLGKSDDYYECNFSSEMPELNYDNIAVREKVLEIAKYYLDMGVDGFRFDAAKYIYFGNNVKSAEFWEWYVAELKKIKSDIYVVGEVWDNDATMDIYNQAGLSCFNFTMSEQSGYICRTAKGKSSVSAYTDYIESSLEKLNGYNKNVMIHQFISNHDMDRIAGYLTIESGEAYMAANIYILSHGSPFIYYGEEIGIKGVRGGASTDANRRLKMLWGDDDTIKNPIGSTYKEKNQINGTVAEHILDKDSLYNHYKKLIMIRKAYPEIARGEFVSLKSYNTKVGGFISTYENSSVCVIHNTGTESVTIDLVDLGAQQFKLLCTFAGKGDAKLDGSKLVIGPMTSVILK